MEKKSISTIEFSGKKADQESCSEKFLLVGKHKGSKKLWMSSRSTSGVDKTPMQEVYENAFKSVTDINKQIIKLGELNELAYEDLILLNSRLIYKMDNCHC